ncbi:hypothetical protein J6590_074673 [Homalodisca vitripennis]|nr:hypothetical protein J6590_074673 [Homalodisca vitripennis]
MNGSTAGISVCRACNDLFCKASTIRVERPHAVFRAKFMAPSHVMAGGNDNTAVHQ